MLVVLPAQPFLRHAIRIVAESTKDRDKPLRQVLVDLDLQSRADDRRNRHVVTGRRRREGNGRPDLLLGQGRKVRQDFLNAGAVRKVREHHSEEDSSTREDCLSRADLGIAHEVSSVVHRDLR